MKTTWCGDVDDNDDELFLWYGSMTKGVYPCFQLGLLSEILTITNLRHAASRTWTWQNLSSGFVVWSCAVATVYHGESAYSTKRFHPVEQQEEFVGAMLLRLSRTNRFSYILYQGLDSILRFVVNLAFLS